MSYLMQGATTKKAKQTEPIPGREKDMTKNNAGGYAFKADSWAIFERFLILGSCGGTYYVSEKRLTSQNIDNVRACIANDGLRAVQTIVDISVSGRAPKNDPALYALALCASFSDEKVRIAALAALPRVARIGTHLFTFAVFIDSMRGWGPALRRAVGEWYTEKPVEKLAYQLAKYQNRNGWSHYDLMRLAHPNPSSDPVKSSLFKWVAKKEVAENLPAIILAMEEAKGADEKIVARLIKDRGLTREMIPTEVQKSPLIWEALLEKMPMGAMVRTLGRMGVCGLLAPLSEASKLVVSRLQNVELLKNSRLHPINLLSALLTYKNGHGQKGSLTWTVVPQVVDALNDAFYAAFDNVEPTNKNFYLGIDVSGSMTCRAVAGVEGLTPNMGAAAMAMLVARTEPNHFIGGFSYQFINLGISKSDRLDAAMAKCQRNFGATDCAIAINHALINKYPVDAFVIATDGETFAGNQHASQSIVNYRQKTGRDAKLIVINMVANKTSLADPLDEGSLDCIGFDSSVPSIISEFVGASKSSRIEDVD